MSNPNERGLSAMESICRCGGVTEEVGEPREVTFGHWSVTVDDRFQRCGTCGEKWYLPGQMQATQERAARMVRAEHGLFEPDRIRALRERYGLTQSQLERLLRVGPKTVVRWERGSVVPGAAASSLLEIIETLPEAAERLAWASGVILKKTGPISLPPPTMIDVPAEGASVYQATGAAVEPMKAVA